LGGAGYLGPNGDIADLSTRVPAGTASGRHLGDGPAGRLHRGHLGGARRAGRTGAARLQAGSSAPTGVRFLDDVFDEVEVTSTFRTARR
jgi:hypothetical protein